MNDCGGENALVMDGECPEECWGSPVDCPGKVPITGRISGLLFYRVQISKKARINR